MAMTVTSKVLYEGVRNITMQFTGTSDGSGDEDLVTKVDVSVLNPPCKRVAIEKITYDVAYGILKMFWDALTPVEFMSLGTAGVFDYDKIGGLQNTPFEEDVTGDILFSTEGFELNSTYAITLEMVKKGVA